MEDLLSQPSPSQRVESKRHSTVSLLLALPSFWRRIALVIVFVFAVTSFLLLARINDRFLVEVPQKGASISEGIIGRPRFVNPVIAKSDADRDLSELVYSGLLRATSDNQFVPDLALRYEVSPDGLTYTFTLRDGVVWHDGIAVTSADVAFTIDKVRDPGLAIKSPRRASWEGVTVETPDPLTIVFRIKQPYAPFLENATMGILPKHIWENVPNDEFDVTYHNIKPIGSGPYRVGAIIQDADSGLPKSYDLIAFKRYARGEPYITNLRISFFGNNAELTGAYVKHEIDQMHTIEPALAHEIESGGAHIEQAPLPRVFAVYFNQNQQPVFADIAVRRALREAVDRQAIVEKVLMGYGRATRAPLPPLFTGVPTDETSTSSESRIQNARGILEKGGWTQNAASVYEKIDKKKKTTQTLEFSIAVPDVPELRQSAEMLRADWEAIGAHVTVKVFELTTFSAEVLSPRKYDALFFGQVIGRTPDLFAYWHSSQRLSPGLNVSLYANKKVDKLLEDARQERDDATRSQTMETILSEIDNDVPAIFIYSPDFLYATGGNVRGIATGLITTESERFLDVSNWYIKSERVWKWFAERDKRERLQLTDPIIY